MMMIYYTVLCNGDRLCETTDPLLAVREAKEFRGMGYRNVVIRRRTEETLTIEELEAVE